MDPALDAALDRARARLRDARRVFVLTGAGVSAESGVPTFRGAGGLWRGVRPETLATPEAFARDPEGVWAWYAWRRERVAAAAPNAAHAALVALEARCESFLLATQNVDGLHERAGSREVLRLHGSLWRVRCTRCGDERDDRRVPLPEGVPRCGCGGALRPAVVWFGEALPAGAIERAAEAARTADVALVVGTSAVVWPAAGLGEAALEAGVPLVEVNPERTAYSDRALSLCGPAAELLPRIVAA